MRKFLSIFLALAMTLSLLPTFALAVENEVEPSGNVAAAYKVGSDTDLQAVIDSVENGTTIKLMEDVTVSGQQVTFGEGRALTLDLNGKTLKINGYTAKAAQVSVVGDLTVQDNSETKEGEICSTYTGTAGLVVCVENGGKLRMQGGTITTEGMQNAGNAVRIMSGGTAEMSGGTIKCDAKRGNRAVNVSSKKNIVGSFTMTGGSVIAEMGDGTETFILAVCGASNCPISISGNSIVSGPEAVSARNSNCTIAGGSFTGKVEVKNKSITGGTFSSEPPAAYLANGFTAVQDGEVWKLSDPVAEINGVKYGSLAEAVKAVPENGVGTIVLIDNVNIPNDSQWPPTLWINYGRKITIDLNGHDVSITDGTIIVQNGALSLTGNGHIIRMQSNSQYAMTPVITLAGNGVDTADYAVVDVGEHITIKNEGGNYGISITQAPVENANYGYGEKLNLAGKVIAKYGIYVREEIQGQGVNIPEVTVTETGSIESTAENGSALNASGYAKYTVKGTVKGKSIGINVGAGVLSIDGTAKITASDKAIAVVGNNNGLPVEVSITGGEISAAGENGKTLYKEETAENANITVSGGTFTADPSAYLADDCCVKNNNGTFVVGVHVLEMANAVAATCTEQGHNAYYTCENCGKTYKDESGTRETTIVAEMIPATGHSWGSWERVNDEQHKRVCENDVNHVETAAHTWGVGEVAKAATCKEAGEMTYTCTVCRATKTEVIPMRREHTLQLVPEVPATCGASGTEAYYKCSVCGRMFEDMTCDVEYREYPPAILPTGQHTFGDWTVTKQATYTEKGEREHTCMVCQNTYTEEIPMLTPSSDSSSSSGSTTTKTETTTNPDGSTTKTETKADGTTVETTTGKDGTTTKTESKTETKSDGSKVETKTETVTAKDGSKTETESKTEVKPDGSSVETKKETVTAKDGSKTESKTETTTAADGSKTETKSETKTAADGTKTETENKTETKADGTTTGTETRKTTDVNGSTGTTTTTTKNGNTKTEAEAKISEKAAEEAKKNDAPVTAPVEVKAGESSDSAPTVKIELPENAGKTKVEIPVSDVNSGTVAVIVNEDGTEEIVKNAIVTENGVVLGVEGNTTVKIIDNSKDFIDTRNHWSRDEVNFVAARELFNGVGNNLFGVSGDMTRGMVNTVLARLAGEDTTGGANWYDKGTEWAKKNGITDGTNPTANVTREQLAAMLYRFAGSPAVSGELSFADADQISGYAKDALFWAVQNGILNGIGNNLIAPKNSAERAQVAAMMARYLKNVG